MARLITDIHEVQFDVHDVFDLGLLQREFEAIVAQFQVLHQRADLATVEQTPHAFELAQFNRVLGAATVGTIVDDFRPGCS